MSFVTENIAAGLAYLLGGPLLGVMSVREVFVVTAIGGLGAALFTGLLRLPQVATQQSQKGT